MGGGVKSLCDEFCAMSVPWLRDSDERQIFKDVSARGLGGVALMSSLTESELEETDRLALSEKEMEFAHAVATLDFGRLQELQLRRVVERFRVRTVESSDVRLMGLLTKTWDKRGFEHVLRACAAAAVPFVALDCELLQVDRAIVETCKSAPAAIGEVLGVIGQFVGPAYFELLFERLGQHCGVAECVIANATIALVWECTRALWKSGWVRSLPSLQSRAIASPSGKLFQLMRQDGCYCGEWNGARPGFVRNADICRELIWEGSVNLEAGDRGKSALAFDAEWVGGGSVARVLLEAGANIQSVLEASRICPRVLVAILAVHPTFASVLLQEPHIEKLLWSGAKDAMLLAQCLKTYGARIPPSLVYGLMADAQAKQLLCALFSFRLIDLETFPELCRLLWDMPAEQRGRWLLWRPHTHVFCSPRVRQRVTACVWCFGILSPQLPRELQYLILQE